MRKPPLSSLLVIFGFFTSFARADIFEVPLPGIAGDYSLGLGTRKDFSFDLGFPLAEIHDVRLRVEGSIVAPWAAGPFDPAGPYDAYFTAYLGDFGVVGNAAKVPGAGKATFPGPEAFQADVPFNTARWTFLEDGTARGDVHLLAELDLETRNIVGGSGTITAASLIIDATAVPEPGLAGLGIFALWSLWRRCRFA